MKQSFSIIILILLHFPNCIAQKETPLFIDISEDIFNPKHYIITKTNEQIQVDGLADETAWHSTLFSESFIDIEGVKKPKYDTKIKMLWDENYLYVFSQMQEPHVWANLKQRDTIIFYNNDFEVFIDPSGTANNYGEIEINALGTVWDLLLDKPYRVGGKANNDWNLEALKSAIYIQGTLNHANDIDTLWSVELAIPMKSLIELKTKSHALPKEGEQCVINFSCGQ